MLPIVNPAVDTLPVTITVEKSDPGELEALIGIAETLKQFRGKLGVKVTGTFVLLDPATVPHCSSIPPIH